MLFLPITFTLMRSVYLSCKQVVTYNEYELINRCDVLTEEAWGTSQSVNPTSQSQLSQHILVSGPNDVKSNKIASQ